IHFHYTAGEIPPLVIAAIFGAARLSRAGFLRPATLGAVAAGAALAGNYYLGAIPLWRWLPGGSSFQASAYTVTPHDRTAAAALRAIPRDAVVSATNTLGGHLSARRRILSFPLLQDAGWVAVDEARLSYLDGNRHELAARALARLRRDRSWRLVRADDGVLVFRRVSRGSPAAAAAVPSSRAERSSPPGAAR